MESATTTPSISTPSPANSDVTSISCTTVSTSEQQTSGGESVENQVHQLANTWSFWLMYQAQTKDKKDNWKSTQKRVLDFSTAEDFWRVINNVSSPSRLSYADYSVFRSGVSPMWEDPVCAKGGRWIVAVDRFMRRDARSSGQEEALDESWLNVMLSLIGGSTYLDDSTGEDIPICGSVCSMRKYNCKIALWVGTADEDILMKAGRQFKESLKPLIDYMTNVSNSASSEEDTTSRHGGRGPKSVVRPKVIQFEFFSNDNKTDKSIEIPFADDEC
ncbi:hypothetical protein FOZ63_027788 [Perkinsus olseni]|uniref:Eukaryotic translation initiation factor 4E n=1 Tax=Perkinsus olseni TaxID=32597 RepID=A0A7J6RTN9_PEROL|nr:hypothetical protein FOZ63_027788 [Perkinsus olseni]KAF4744512.1 hypothetical protein FOZ62_026485 [Perkinsus olseni]